MTPVSTINTAPLEAATSAGTRPKDPATITHSRTPSATNVFEGWGARLVAAWHSATAGLRATASSFSPET